MRLPRVLWPGRRNAAGLLSLVVMYEARRFWNILDWDTVAPLPSALALGSGHSVGAGIPPATDH
jgi:hypothetical protein